MSSVGISELLDACLPAPHDHRAGGVEQALAILQRDPDAAHADIWTACACGELDTVRSMLADAPDLAITAGGRREWVPLLYLSFSRFLRLDPARAARMVEIASLLLANDADPNAYWIDANEGAGNRESALYGAAGVANNVELTRLLIEAGADPNDGETPYHMVEHEAVPCAHLVFAHLDETSRSIALLHKIDYPDLGGLRTLLELGADPNGRSPFKNFGLHQAVFRGHPKPFFDLLIEHGADLDRPNGDGKTPYALAARSGRSEIMEWLAAAGADTRLDPVDAFLAACGAGETARVSELLETDPQLFSTLSDHDRAEICEAADAGNTAAVRTMLDVGWEVNTRGRVWHETALHRAAMQGHLETARLLYERGSDLTIRDRFYQSSALGWALHGEHLELARLLGSVPGRLDIRDTAQCGYAERTLELLGSGDPDAEVAGGDPGVLLRAAAASGNVELVGALLERGADASLRNRDGLSAVQVAEAAGEVEVVRQLQRAPLP